MVANIAAPKSKPMTDQAFMANFLHTQMRQRGCHCRAERWLNGPVAAYAP
jgi:hypothetical protein